MLGGLLLVGLVLIMFEPVEFVMFLPVKVPFVLFWANVLPNPTKGIRSTNDNPNTIIVLSILISARIVFYK
jgi:hypothetical protein